eukprot:1138165-Prymnesium_polylepis.2
MFHCAPSSRRASRPSPRTHTQGSSESTFARSCQKKGAWLARSATIIKLNLTRTDDFWYSRRPRRSRRSGCSRWYGEEVLCPSQSESYNKPPLSHTKLIFTARHTVQLGMYAAAFGGSGKKRPNAPCPTLTRSATRLPRSV